MKRRRDMKPGEMFVKPVVYVDGICFATQDVLVVLDAKFETSFWRGGLWAYGDVAPNMTVELVNG